MNDTINRRSLLRLAAGTSAALLASTTPSMAQTAAWPTKPVRLIIPFPAGGTTDIVGRLLAQDLSVRLGQPVVAENRGGAGGNLAVAAAAKSPADGYTFVLGTSGTHGVNVSLYRELGFDPVGDFVPVLAVAAAPVVLAVRRSLNVDTLKGLIDLARSKPGTITLASAGNGTTQHLSQALLNMRAGIETVHVPYRSGSQAIMDLVAGRVDAMFYHLSGLEPYFKDGSLIPLATTALRRMSQLPDVPTLEQAGLKDFVVEGWWGLYAPAETPAPIVMRVNEAGNAFLKMPDTIEKFGVQGIEPLGGPPSALAERTAREVAKWRDVVQAANIRLD